jgi:acetyl esterase/lipase
MSIYNTSKKRSLQSIAYEKLILLSGSKHIYSDIQRTENLVEKNGIKNKEMYQLLKVKLQSTLEESSFENMQVFTVNNKNSDKQKVVYYIHGGAWTNQPIKYHWAFIDKLAKELDVKVVVPIYPKVPEFSYEAVYPKLLSLYQDIVSSLDNTKQLYLMGDSAGGNISLGLSQLIVKENLPQPNKIILLSACVDMGFKNPKIPQYEKRDPMLSATGMEAITKIWAADKNQKDPLISPVHGDFSELPAIIHFIGTHESLYPDAVRFDKIVERQGGKIHTYVYPKMNHVFVLLPIPEAEDAFRRIKKIISIS